jgi:hypothetical protein
MLRESRSVRGDDRLAHSSPTPLRDRAWLYNGHLRWIVSDRLRRQGAQPGRSGLIRFQPSEIMRLAVQCWPHRSCMIAACRRRSHHAGAIIVLPGRPGRHAADLGTAVLISPWRTGWC